MKTPDPPQDCPAAGTGSEDLDLTSAVHDARVAFQAARRTQTDMRARYEHARKTDPTSAATDQAREAWASATHTFWARFVIYEAARDRLSGVHRPAPRQA